MTIFTIGYEGLDIPTFLRLLSRHRIQTLVDIRELPLSRKPGFSKRALAENLNKAGFGYVHMVQLGCPKPVRDRYKQDSKWQRYTAGFLRHLDGQEDAIQLLAERAADSRCALLCFEADYRFCHRSLVANAVARLGAAKVLHISASTAKTALPEQSLLELA